MAASCSMTHLRYGPMIFFIMICLVFSFRISTNLTFIPSWENLLSPIPETQNEREHGVREDQNSRISVSENSKPNGVFVMKVKTLQQASRTICTLTRFLNSKTRYPIHIFSQQPYSNDTLTQIRSYANGVDIQVIVDEQRWKELPPELTPEERIRVMNQCKNFDTPEKAICTTMNVPLAYVYMGYWRYMLMPFEPSLQKFEYFVSVDADGYFTQSFPDPFVLMKEHNLTGIFNVEQIQTHQIAAGIQGASEAVFSLEERKNRYLDTPKTQYFNAYGRWVNQKGLHPSIWGSFFGGRLDFFRTPRFRSFAKRMVPFTYSNRTDEQAVIGVAWSLMASDQVWHLSQRGIPLGFFHQMWCDNQQLVDTRLRKPPPSYNETTNTSVYWVHTLKSWHNFHVYQTYDLILYEEYMRTLNYEPGDDWERCICAPTKMNYLLRKSCPNWKEYDH